MGHALIIGHLYWDNSEGCNLPLIWKNKKITIHRYKNVSLFVYHNSIDKLDKLAKIMIFNDLFYQNLQQFGIFSDYLNTDEEMIICTGRQSGRMYKRGKRINRINV